MNQREAMAPYKEFSRTFVAFWTRSQRCASSFNLFFSSRSVVASACRFSLSISFCALTRPSNVSAVISAMKPTDDVSKQ